MYDSWRGRLYPDKLAKRRWLERYAEVFDTVEVNSTFYRLARREAVAGWIEQTPAGFEFAVKASRYLTHIKRLVDIGDGIRRFYEPLATDDRGRSARARVCGSCPRTSIATTRGSRGGSSCSRPAGTRSSSATRAGSCRRCSRGFATAEWR